MHTRDPIARRTLLAAGSVLAVGAVLPTFAHAKPRQSREGFAEVPGGKVWWRIVGTGPKTPLPLLHGGPGAGHDYLEPLSQLASDRPLAELQL